jgi:hypothetical protein
MLCKVYLFEKFQLFSNISGYGLIEIGNVMRNTIENKQPFPSIETVFGFGTVAYGCYNN